jgi:hypothetical protein
MKKGLRPLVPYLNATEADSCWVDLRPFNNGISIPSAVNAPVESAFQGKLATYALMVIGVARR